MKIELRRSKLESAPKQVHGTTAKQVHGTTAKQVHGTINA